MTNFDLFSLLLVEYHQTQNPKKLCIDTSTLIEIYEYNFFYPSIWFILLLLDFVVQNIDYYPQQHF